MNDTNQKKLGSTLWGIADQLRGAMDADDFRDYMLSFLFLRYLSDNYETSAKKELGKDYTPKKGCCLEGAFAIRPRCLFQWFTAAIEASLNHRDALPLVTAP